MESEICPLGQQENIIEQKAGKEILIYDLSRNKAFCLNETCALVWKLADGKNSVSEIRQKISSSLKTPVDEEIIWWSLEQLKNENLISEETKFHTVFEGLSRREIIKRIGITTVIALPLISALVAPTAVDAQSICPAGACGFGTDGNTGCPCIGGIGGQCNAPIGVCVQVSPTESRCCLR